MTLTQVAVGDGRFVSDVSPPEGELGGVSLPVDLLREFSLDGTVVLASDVPSTNTSKAEAIAGSRGWRLVKAPDAETAAWVTAIQRTSLVIVAASSAAVARSMVQAARRSSSAPILVVGEHSSTHRVEILAEGADLFVGAGVSEAELHACIVALLRRAGETWQPAVRFLSGGTVQVDLWTRRCVVAATPVALSPTEFQLLVYLMRHANQALSTHKIVQRVWHNWGYADGLNTLRIHISRLRRKLGETPDGSSCIRSVRGVGYEFTHSVLEVGDGPAHEGSRNLGELTLSTLILEVAGQLESQPLATAVEYVVDALVGRVGCDAAAVFRRQGERLMLVAERGNTDRWREEMSGGIPLRPGYAQVHALQTAQPAQYADIGSSNRQCSETAKILSRDGFHSCLFLPIVSNSVAWGGLGLASRARRPFDPVVTTFCSAVASLLSLAVSRPE